MMSDAVLSTMTKIFPMCRAATALQAESGGLRELTAALQLFEKAVATQLNLQVHENP
jgi:hypothetical protein